MIEIRIDDNAQRILASLKAFQAGGMFRAIAKSMNEQSQELIGSIVLKRMSATPVAGTFQGREQSRANVKAHLLGRRTSHGVGSLNDGSGARVTSDGAEATVGTNLSYIKAHEVGFTGSVSVKKHIRQQKSRDKFGQRLNFKTGFEGRTQLATGVSFVTKGKQKSWLPGGAFVRKVDIPARHMIEWGIKDYAPTYSQGISRAIHLAWLRSDKA